MSSKGPIGPNAVGMFAKDPEAYLFVDCAKPENTIRQ